MWGPPLSPVTELPLSESTWLATGLRVGRADSIFWLWLWQEKAKKAEQTLEWKSAPDLHGSLDFCPLFFFFKARSHSYFVTLHFVTLYFVTLHFVTLYFVTLYFVTLYLLCCTLPCRSH